MMSDALGTGTGTLWSDTDMLTRYERAFEAEPDVHLWAFLLWMRDSYEAKIAELEMQLAEANRWVPNVMSYQTGVLSTLIETANSPGEDEAWAHLQDEDD